MNKQFNQIYDDEIDLREVFISLWTGKWIILGVTLVFAVGAIVSTLRLPNQYKATAVLAPIQHDSPSLSASLASNLGNLASLAGINLNRTGGNESQIAMEVVESWGFIDEFIRENKIEVEVFAAKGWDRKSNTITVNKDIYNPEMKEWVTNSSRETTAGPSSWELYKAFSKRLNVSQSKESGLVSISIEYYSPVIAKEWVDSIVKAINEYMRVRKLEQVNKNIEYLSAQVEKTSIAQLKEVFYQIIEEQIKTKMLAEVSHEYVFSTVSDAMVAEEKSGPRRSFTVMLVTFVGAILSMFAVLMVHISGYGSSLRRLPGVLPPQFLRTS